MAKIPGPIWIIIGITISAYSKFVQMKNPSPAFNGFFYLGIVFIFWGVVRVIFSPNRTKAVTREELNVKPRTVSGIVFCPRCGTKQLRPDVRFCHACGHRNR